MIKYEDYYYLILWNYKRWKNYADINKLTKDDVISIFNLAFVKCVKKFDPSQGVKFHTVFVTYMKNELKSHIRSMRCKKNQFVNQKVEQTYEIDYHKDEIYKYLYDEIEKLEPNVKRVIKHILKYGDKAGAKLAIKMDCSKQWINQLKHKGFKQLRKNLEKIAC